MKKALYAASLLLAAGAAFLMYHVYAPRVTAEPQPPLTRLELPGFVELRDQFNATSDRTRVIVMLSPT